MTVSGEHITYPGPNGPVRAYLARSEGSGPWPGVIVVSEVVGLDEHMEDMGRRFAGEGYLAVVPDLYSQDDLFKTVTPQGIVSAIVLRGVPDPEAAIKAMPADRQEPASKAWHWLTHRDQSTYVPDLQAALDFLKGRSDCSGTVGAVGYCMGGGLVGTLAASGADLDAAMIFYGANPPAEKVPNIKCPMEGHYGGADPFLPPNLGPELQAAMDANGKRFAYYYYDGAGHAFNNDTEQWFHAEAAKLSWERTKDFLARHLKGVPAAAR